MDPVTYQRPVYYYETDRMDCVHHSNYIRWFEEARMDMMEQMGMGYAGQLETCPELSEENRNKISVIRHQSIRMKNLINDLNLASKLEYQMQPLHPRPMNLVAALRQCAVDFINADLDGRYPLEWKIPAPSLATKLFWKGLFITC